MVKGIGQTVTGRCLMPGKKYFEIALLSVLVLLTVGIGEVRPKEKYPTRAIDILVPFSAGGAADLTGRLLADFCKKEWRVPVNVINKPGGNTLIATLEMYQADPDGYTLLLDNRNAASLLPFVVKDLPIKVMDRTFIAITNVSPHFFAVPVNSPYKTMPDVVEDLKKSPESFTWTSLGAASTQDYMFRQLCKAVGVDVQKTKPVFTQGGAQVATLVGGGHVKLAVVSSASGIPLMKGGTARALMISSAKRDPNYPNVPTGIEVGYPTVNVIYWMGVSGPPKLSPDIVDTWSKTLQKMVKDPAYIAKALKMGLPPGYKGPSEEIEFVKKEMEEIRNLLGEQSAK